MTTASSGNRLVQLEVQPSFEPRMILPAPSLGCVFPLANHTITLGGQLAECGSVDTAVAGHVPGKQAPACEMNFL